VRGEIDCISAGLWWISMRGLVGIERVRFDGETSKQRTSPDSPTCQGYFPCKSWRLRVEGTRKSIFFRGKRQQKIITYHSKAVASKTRASKSCGYSDYFAMPDYWSDSQEYGETNEWS
jgi:hypothetical protein